MRRTERVQRRAALVLAAAVVLSASCTSAPSGSAAGPGDPSSASPVLEYVVAAGEMGVALVGDSWLEAVPEITAPALIYAGPVAVQADGQSSAVVASDRIALVRPHMQAIALDCTDCSGVAVSKDRIVTTRRNLTPDDGFDIVTFDHSLNAQHAVASHRLRERADADGPHENNESPVTLAADERTVTVGYLSRNGGIRGGPSIIAEYDYTGRLLRSVVVDGIVGRTVASPNGHYLAVDVKGSSGACVTESAVAVLDLATYKVRIASPVVPVGVHAKDPLTPPWFEESDLAWDQAEVVATGSVMVPPPDTSGCDPAPASYERRVDVLTGAVQDIPVPHLAVRHLGAGCGVTITLRNGVSDGGRELVRESSDGRTPLGAYSDLGQAPAPGAAC